MLLFRSEETINRWCEAKKIPRRPLISLEQLWQLAVHWYANRLSVESRRPAADEMVSIFASVGFWTILGSEIGSMEDVVGQAHRLPT
jgi:hypothetical protein